MNTIIRSAIMAGGVAALAACNVIQPEAFNKQGLEPAKVAMDGVSPFSRSLNQGYASFAAWEYQQADFRDATYFNDKAKASSLGIPVLPTAMNERKIRQEFLTELVPARERLMRAISDQTVIQRAPNPAGAAQVYFDCWAEQAEEGFQYDHIAYCKQGFETAMGQLNATPAAQAPQPAQPATARPFLIFFDWDRSNINQSAQQTIDQISTTIKNTNPANVRIAGHADKSGPDAYNDALSRRRAEAVLGALQQQGLQRNKATVEAFGESRPLVDTADGVREPQNRRVEVTIR